MTIDCALFAGVACALQMEALPLKGETTKGMKYMKMNAIQWVFLAVLTLASAGRGEPVGAAAPRSHMARAVMHSDVVDSASYDLVRHELTVFFRNGSAYAYNNVGEDVFSGLVNAGKPGRFFTRNIRGKYESRRLPPRTAATSADASETASAW
jgi:hypothetical protein